MYGLVLEGGGAKGSYQIGAYKAIKEMNIEIGGIAGTSVGAINGALIIQNNWDRAYDIWYNINLSRLFDVDQVVLNEIRNLNFNHNNIKYIYNRLKTILNNRGIDLKKIRKLLVENIDEEAIRSSDMDFGIVTINLSEMEPMELYLEDIPEGSLVDYLIASSYLPTFKMEKMDGSLYLDGGFYNNLPINLLVDRGYENIIAVRTYAIGRVPDMKNKKLTIDYIAPEENLGGILEFEQERIRNNIKLGYYDTLKFFKDLKGKRYYIEIEDSESSKDRYVDFFLNINQGQLELLTEILDAKNLKGKRMLFEKIIPKLAVLLDVDKECDYEDIVLGLMEYAAEKLDIERFKIYKFDDFVREISDKQKRKEDLETSNIPGFVLHNDLLSRAVKEQILNDIIRVIFAGVK
ncbi:MAG: patatin-like phospholipase family protein [Halanaerobiaceae bacterium]